MLSQEEIQNHNRAEVNAIFARFSNAEELMKSEDAPKVEDKKEEGLEKSEMYWTEEGLNSFKNDLFKGIDEGTLSSDNLEKALEDIKSLKAETREIDGKETTVYVK